MKSTIFSVVSILCTAPTTIFAKPYPLDAPTSSNSSPSPLTFNFKITNPDGTPADPSSFTIHHAFNPPSPQKRDSQPAPIALTSCPPGERFLTSFAERSLSPQNYRIQCQDISDTSITNIIEGACDYNAVVFDGILTPFSTPEQPISPTYRAAYCYSTEYFMPVEGNGSIEATLDPSVWTSDIAIEAVLTGVDVTQVLMAAEMEIEAQEADEQPDTSAGGGGFLLHATKTLAGGYNACMDCSSVGIQPVPNGSAQVEVSTKLKEGSPHGRLYLGAIIPRTG
ncbi:hypothetical protein MMC20_006426 [Loxospora ochrophaea]|nr:hypothetical protein [Loxospora ochrophaea]